MRKRILFTLFFITAVAVSSLRCAPQVDVRAEAFTALEQMYKSGVQRMDAEIAQFDQELRNIDDRVVKLEEIVPQAEKWLEEKKSGDLDVPCG